MSKILNNNAKLELLQFDQDKELNCFKFREKKYQCSEITEVDYNHLYPCSVLPGILYGLVKVHEPVTDQRPYFRSILLKIS